ncbi:MAG: hypothetical protein V4804_10705 [Pseudomonadota bacterium]
MWIESVVAWLAKPENALAFSQLAAAAVTAIATIALWRVTRILAVETKTLAAMTSRPFVVCSAESSPISANSFNLVLRSTGNATAFDVRVQLSPPIANPDGSQLADDTMTSWEVSLLPPGQALTKYVGFGPDIHDKTYSANVSWASLPGSSARESLSYKFQGKDGFQGGVIAKGPHHIAEEFEKLRKQIASGTK